MDDQVARADIVGQLVEQREAALLKVFLHLDFIGLALERAELVGELEAIGSKLAADTRQEDFHRLTFLSRQAYGSSIHFAPDLSSNAAPSAGILLVRPIA